MHTLNAVHSMDVMWWKVHIKNLSSFNLFSPIFLVFNLAIGVVVDPFYKPKERTIMKMLRAKIQPILSTSSLERRLKPTSGTESSYFYFSRFTLK